MSTLDDALDLAASHGLRPSPDGATVIEAGLDYRVIMATDETGNRWVLRIPRREDVPEGMAAEVRILDFVAPALRSEKVAVPDWRIRTPELVAYPALPGAPGLTLSETAEPMWHMDPADPDYAVRLGRLLACLHSVDAEEAKTAGVEVRSPEQVRQAWRDDITTVINEFTVAPALATIWHAWIEDDTCWPGHTVMTHGEIYPAHVLLDADGTITGVVSIEGFRWRPKCTAVLSHVSRGTSNTPSTDVKISVLAAFLELSCRFILAEILFLYRHCAVNNYCNERNKHKDSRRIRERCL